MSYAGAEPEYRQKAIRALRTGLRTIRAVDGETLQSQSMPLLGADQPDNATDLPM